MEDNYSYLEDDDEQVPQIRQVNRTDQPGEHRRSIGEHQGSNMKYLIIGAGGTGGILGYKMAKGGLDVTMIARGKQLRAIWGNGILVENQWDHSVDSAPVKAYDTSNYYDDPDVIFLCVKSYSVKSLPSSVDVLGKFRSFDRPECQTSWHRLSDRPLAT